ncbi:uncharacterized protein LOC117640425 [Thrips palmi]|uniref:Uncharacterized protein LOC117640425 n=1 Tax=Thrips palmi TaxID=161013 RepID=A0A6P8Y9K2_THRPL|nr:uncharacterized protein LOC117640425 [Thrips palmi]
MQLLAIINFQKLLAVQAWHQESPVQGLEWASILNLILKLFKRKMIQDKKVKQHLIVKFSWKKLLCSKQQITRPRLGLSVNGQDQSAVLEKKNDTREESRSTSTREVATFLKAADKPQLGLGLGSSGQHQSATLKKKHGSIQESDSTSEREVDSDDVGLLDASISSPEARSSDDESLAVETDVSTCKKPVRKLFSKALDENRLAKPLSPQSVVDSTPSTCSFNARRVKANCDAMKTTCIKGNA